MRLRKCCQHDRRSHRRWCRCSRALAQLLFDLQRCRRFGFHGLHHGSTATRRRRALLAGTHSCATGTCRGALDDGDPRIHSYLRGDPQLTIYFRGTHSCATGTPGYPSTSQAVPPPAHGVAAAAAPTPAALPAETLLQKVDRIRRVLELDTALSLVNTIKAANELVGIGLTQGATPAPLLSQVDKLLATIGI